jgi:hypothetical protein
MKIRFIVQGNLKSRLLMPVLMGTIVFAAFSIAPVCAQAQTNPGMPFIAATASQAPLLNEFLEGEVPAVIPDNFSLADPTGQIGTFRGTLLQSSPGALFTGVQAAGDFQTAGNLFFDTSISTNGRQCSLCHQPENGWSITPSTVYSQYQATSGKSALFQSIDAAVCPDSPLLFSVYPVPIPTSQFIQAHYQLFQFGNFRIAINAPNPLGPKNASFTTFNGNTNPEWVLTLLSDPYGCQMDKTYGLPNNQVGLYRRPLATANVAFLARNDGITNHVAQGPVDTMWDGRESDLFVQFIDAVQFHGQNPNFATPPLGALIEAQIDAAVQFQSNTFTGQVYDNYAGDLTGGDNSGALGGPLNLLNQEGPLLNAWASTLAAIPPLEGLLAGIGIPIPPFSLFGNFGEQQFPPVPHVFSFPALPNPVSNFYGPFASSSNAMRQSIARGEALFNNVTLSFTVFAVDGLQAAFAAAGSDFEATGVSCNFCHNNIHYMDDGVAPGFRNGIMDNSNMVDTHTATELSNAGLKLNVLPIDSYNFPVYAFYCKSGSISYFSNPVTSWNCPGSAAAQKPLTCDEFITADPGTGLITGKCDDLGKMKTPQLRGLAARAPYFHNGSMPDLLHVVRFYENRFNFKLTAQQEQDLVNFLNSL